MTKEEFNEWRQMSVTQEFFKYMEEARITLATTSTLRETADMTLKATAFKEGQMSMIQAMSEVDFAE
jgi:hypothetical protein